MRAPLVVYASLLVLTSGNLASGPAQVDQDAGNWVMYGRTYDDHRFSPLKQINEQTVEKLGLSLEP